MNIKTFAIKSFGCKVNQYEEQLLREKLINSGFLEVSPDISDVFILNSCTVTNQADKKSLRLIKKIKRINPKAKTIFTGCLAVLSEDINKLKILSEIDEVVPNNEKFNIPNLISQNKDTLIGPVTDCISGFDSHTRVFVMIQDGCEQHCSYCKVSMVRGKPKSREISSILAEIKKLLINGFREIVLTGICIGLWKGRKGETFKDLLAEIISIKGNFRIRISSIEPNHINKDIISLMASTGKICQHLHLPLQSGSDKILKSMNRRYTTLYFEEIIKEVRSKIPLVGISMDVIAGFPGETDIDFTNSLDFIKSINPSRLHVFRYSDRKGTKSFTFKNKIPRIISKERVNKLILHGINMQKKFHETLVGHNLEVLLEEETNNGFLEGYSSQYARVRISGNKELVSALTCFTPHNFDSNKICLY